MTAVTARPRSLQDPDFLHEVHTLREVDNWTNWWHLGREYLFLAVVVGAAIWWYLTLIERGWSLWWMLPVLLITNPCVGAGQHRLATLTHEAAHYMLFRNRLLNEIVSEWCCMFPILGATHPYRVQHLGHHQYPNDPEKDPDWAQMTLSGHRFTFPMSRGRFLWECVVKQVLWAPSLIRYVLVRAFFKVDRRGTPYSMKRRAAPVLVLFNVAYLLGLLGALFALHYRNDLAALALVPAGMWSAAALFYRLAPARWFAVYAVKSDLPPRLQNFMRLTYMTLLFTTLAWLTVWTGWPWPLFWFVLWVVPLGTSFAFFMILRQIVQHGNADRERFTNTRIFEVHPLISLSVFPIGNDYHLPHHLFPLVPHYNLRKLHRLLMETREYGEQAVLVEGYFFPAHRPKTHPTVLDVMTAPAPGGILPQGG